MIYRILALLISISMLSFAAIAKEQYPGQYAQVNPAISDFFKNYKRTVPGGNGGYFNCCDVSDCHILSGDMWDLRGSDYWVYVKEFDRPGNDPWFKVPNEILVLDHPPPPEINGGAILCYRATPTTISLYCFTPGALF